MKYLRSVRGLVFWVLGLGPKCAFWKQEYVPDIDYPAFEATEYDYLGNTVPHDFQVHVDAVLTRLSLPSRRDHVLPIEIFFYTF